MVQAVGTRAARTGDSRAPDARSSGSGAVARAFAYTLGMQLFTAIAAAVGAVAGLWNAYQFSVLKDRVDEIGRNLTAHTTTPGLHR